MWWETFGGTGGKIWFTWIDNLEFLIGPYCIFRYISHEFESSFHQESAFLLKRMWGETSYQIWINGKYQDIQIRSLDEIFHIRLTHVKTIPRLPAISLCFWYPRVTHLWVNFLSFLSQFLFFFIYSFIHFYLIYLFFFFYCSWFTMFFQFLL